jgi:hypothetical protein
MSRLAHTRFPRVAQNEANTAPANVSQCTVAGSVVSLAGTGLSTLTAVVANSRQTAGVTAVASAVSGNAATITIGGTPKDGDQITVVLNGETIKIGGGPAIGLLTTAAIAAAISGHLNVLINGDILSFVAADKATSTTTTLANCSVAGLAIKTLVDNRPTINDTVNNFPVVGVFRVVDDAETSIA